ncbi:hypothetical protein BGW36DRAFT_354716 [Talaromyces proteolyticus]|uniref:Polyketide synthase n=1 Tax=Talaromyces proteolyticus TaxID=1131652 RepID=A0AAD4L308_9EURO|nr:uncharacterized protein BGW36DRAFT_354716 [Talaromyces proteolyticus]KAH8703288.1 hypothetical protein BGW36DRAFT_354716 [Talaromyces proteolyticus]
MVYRQQQMNMDSVFSPSLVIFGPQTTTWPSQKCLSLLRSDLLNEPTLARFADAVRNLPSLWSLIAEVEPRLLSGKTQGLQAFVELQTWLNTGVLECKLESIPSNALQSPLTVILHVVHYIKCVIQRSMCQPRSTDDDLPEKFGLQDNAVDFSEYASVALRLAACLGVFVDLNGGRDDPNETMQAVVVQWKTDLQRLWLLQTMANYPKAYTSVLKDSTTLTIVVPQMSVPSIRQTLLSEGIHVTPLSLAGRYHHSSNADAVRKIIQLAHSRPIEFQFPSTTRLMRPLRANYDAQIIDGGRQDLILHEMAIKSLLMEQVDWHTLMNATLTDGDAERFPSILVVGLTNCLPQEVLHREGGLDIQFSEEVRKLQTSPPLNSGLTPPQLNQENSIAIVGMAGRFPGADTLEEFWTLLQQAKSTLSELPANRFKSDVLRRSVTGTRFWGNFINDIDSFDRQFFKISSREATSMDPQQRLVLQVAVEAMLSAEYFSQRNNPSTDFGCYLGVGSVDYHDNIYSHQPTAYSAVGSLRAFLSGRVAHYFGWTGPSITYDTACSSSMVAIHSACKALLAGECSGALAGGVNIITSPALYQDLGAASFLSPTGASKAFDSAADGYCRGEGCGLVVLKKLSDALATSDPILGVIAGSAINQSENCVSITVPHSGSQSTLYRKVLAQSNLQPSDITYVEAHGTGTPVGDPIEWQSIRAVFGGPQREINSGKSEMKRALHVGSVKGNIGHLEAASGVAALIKSVLMIQKGEIPKQASFTVPWNMGFRGICVNNYGASGTNGALIVCETPASPPPSSAISTISSPRKHIVSIAAHSRRSFQTYCSLLLRQTLSASQQMFNLADYAFNLSHKQNLSAKFRRTAAIESIEELRSLLDDWQDDKGDNEDDQQFPAQSSGQVKPIVLCFGGQSSSIMGLNKEIYETITLFRFYLDEVNTLLSEQGSVTIYPHIFSKDPISDPVTLHCSLFALQYACAMSWINSGVTIRTIIGHSFGQITALCISGVLSLYDSVRYVSGRASLFVNKWNSETGTMITARATDIDGMLPALLATILPETLEVACYNSSSDLVLAGSTSAARKFKTAAAGISNIEVKELNTDRAFHSSLMDDILPDLRRLAASLTFRNPKINIETCTQGSSWTSFTADNLVAHSRQPVYFRDAVQRVKQRLGVSCIWLEAGSRSSIIQLAAKCVMEDSQGSIFLPVDLSNNDRPLDSLLNTTLRLCGIGGYPRIQHWLYHHRQRSHYKQINLPPYQFDMSRYWLEYKDSIEENTYPSDKATSTGNESHRPLQFIGYATSSKDTAVFAVNTRCLDIQTTISGHAVMGNGLCPASLYIELAAQSVYHLSSHDDKHHVAQAATNSTLLLPQVTELRILAPLGLDTSNSIHIELSRSTDIGGRGWSFTLTSNHMSSPKTSTCHASGIIRIQDIDDVHLSADRSALERFVGNNRCLRLLDDRLAESMQGSLIYRVFDRVVNYKSYYQGIQRLSSKGAEVAGVVSMPEASVSLLADNTCEPFLMDNFLQVAGLHVNCLRDTPRNDVYICTFIKEMHMYESLTPLDVTKELPSWNVYGYTKELDDIKRNLESDILVFNGVTKSLAVALLGVRFSRVNMISLGKTLSFINSTAGVAPSTTSNAPVISRSLENLDSEELLDSTLATQIRKGQEDIPCPENVTTLSLLHTQLKELLSSFTDIPTKEIDDSTTLEALGIDSLMETEFLSEIRSAFCIAVPADELRGISVAGLLSLLDSEKPPSSNSTRCSVPSSDVSTQGTQFSTVSTSSLVQKRDTSKNVSFHTENVQSNFSTLVNSHDLLQPAIEKEARKGPTFFDDIHEVFSTIKSGIGIGTGFSGFYTNVHPRQLNLVTAYIVEAFDILRCPLTTISEGEAVRAIPHIHKYEKLVRQLYQILEAAGIISRDGGSVYKRTGYSIDIPSSENLLKNILQDFPHYSDEHRLLAITGPRLADCLCGKVDAISLIFGSRESKELLANVYLNAPMFAAGTQLLCSFLTRLLTLSLPKMNDKSDNYRGKPREGIRILEIGAGTGGTTSRVIPALAACNIPFQYTFSDISASLVATAKQKFAFCKEMTRFTVMDIEQEPNPEFIGKYDIVMSTNCIHATRNLTATMTNIRKLLVPGGLLCLVELTRNLFWFDLVFGLLEGWWLFEDGRTHALASEFMWRECLMDAGYGQVNWTGGNNKESELLRLIIAVNPASPRQSFFTQQTSVQRINQQSEPNRPTVSQSYNSHRNALPKTSLPASMPPRLPLSTEKGAVVLLTGATGSLGSHVLQNLLSRTDVRRVVCLNRLTTQDAVYRQAEALRNRNIEISPQKWSRIQVLETKTEFPKLGLDDMVYGALCDDVTHIVHNAWPMSFRRPLKSFEPQFKALQNLIQLARIISNKTERPSITPRLLFISSIGVVGQHSAIQKNESIPEESILSDSSGLAMGYAQAKLVCEKMIQDVHLEESEADRIEATFARIGQMTGSRMNGVWNPEEHFPALLRSSQTVGALPRIDGSVSWLPVDIAAAVVGDLLLDPRPPHLVYHIENPIRQSWIELVDQFSNHLDVHTTIPYSDWLNRVQRIPDAKETKDGAYSANPARRLFEFFETDFIRMDCGGVILDTTFTQNISRTLREATTVSPEIIAHYISNWKRMGFLK